MGKCWYLSTKGPKLINLFRTIRAVCSHPRLNIGLVGKDRESISTEYAVKFPEGSLTSVMIVIRVPCETLVPSWYH